MRGRFVLATPPAVLIQRFGLTSCVDYGPRYNIAPMTNVVVIRQNVEGERTGEFHRWGLLPSWVKDPSIAGKLNNARGETVNDKASFRSAFRRWRCIIPGEGFYEWTSAQKLMANYFASRVSPSAGHHQQVKRFSAAASSRSVLTL